jgi:mRNA interferase YafQ
MALDLLTTTAFEKDLRRIRKQGKDLDKLEAVVNLLQEEEPLPARCRPHRYAGNGRDIGIATWNRTGYCSTG